MIVGHRARYVLTVSNRGPDTATAIAITDRPASRLRFVAVSVHPGHCSRGRTVRCTLTSLAAHGQMRITVTVVPRAGGAVVNSARVTAATLDRNPSNNIARARGSILGRTRLAVTKTADHASVASGGLVSYHITVRNAGRAAAAGVTVCDLPSQGLALVRFHGARLRDGAACWSIRRLAVGRHRSVAVLARATSTGSGRRITNAVIARGANLSAARATAMVHVLPTRSRPESVTG